MQKVSPLIFVGMHRSGTTMTSKFLDAINVFMGYRVGKVNNEAYYFQYLNEWILAQHGCSWDNPESYYFTNTLVQNEIIRVLKKEMKGRRKFDFLGFRKSLKFTSIEDLNFSWGWKDPKTSITLDLWLKVFPNAKILHIVRHPIDVANSLSKREKELKGNFRKKNELRELESKLSHKPLYQQSVRVEHIEEGIKLWSYYVSSIVKHTKSLDEKQILTIRYEDILASPIPCLEKIGLFVNERKQSKEFLLNFSKEIDASRAFAFKQSKNLIQYENFLESNVECHKLFGY
jgi:hypothetical protein